MTESIRYTTSIIAYAGKHEITGHRCKFGGCQSANGEASEVHGMVLCPFHLERMNGQQERSCGL